MGCYGYICKHCGKSIRGGEYAKLFHVREGKVLGSTEGVYDFYGSTKGEVFFDKYGDIAKNSPNNHDEVMKSCFDLPSSSSVSKEKILFKIYEGNPVSLVDYSKILAEKFPDTYMRDLTTKVEWDWSLQDSCNKEYDKLEDNHNLPIRNSGVAAYHLKCFHIVEKKSTIDYSPSKNDPNQSWGTPRKSFLLRR